jgi:hypothetical protein
MSIYDEDPFIEWNEANDANDDGEAVLAAEREADEATADPGRTSALGTAYEVVWPDGDIYANRNGEIRLTAAEASATARAVGGTWRAATAPGDSRLYFYKLTCGHETPNLYEQEPGTTLVCRGENRAAAAHPATIVRLTRVRDIASEPVPGTASAPPDERERTAEATATSEQHAQPGTGQPEYPAPGSAIPPEKNFGMPGYVVGECGHRVAGSEWRAGFRNCERCGPGYEADEDEDDYGEDGAPECGSGATGGAR